MNYDEWIQRERRARINILNSSPVIKQEHIYRVCQRCGEVCMCHEETCPNCNVLDIRNEKLLDTYDDAIARKMRCFYRFMNLVKEE